MQELTAHPDTAADERGYIIIIVIIIIRTPDEAGLVPVAQPVPAERPPEGKIYFEVSRLPEV